MEIENKDIKLENIVMSPHHWSRPITEDSIDDLAENIDKLGQMHQIVVRPYGKGKRMFELVAGERRFLALKKLGKTRIRCAVMHYDDEEAALASLSEGLKTERPESTAWSKGAKRFTELWQARYGEDEEEEPEPPKKRGKSNGTSDVLKRSGRKKSSRRRAIEAGAKATGVNTKTFTRAIDREENLTASSLRALQKKLISVLQADRLAHMSAAEQKKQLPLMIKETREETKRRLDAEEAAKDSGDAQVARELLDDLLLDCKTVVKKVGDFLAFVDGKDLDYPLLRRADLQAATACGQCTTELTSFVESD